MTLWLMFVFVLFCVALIPPSPEYLRHRDSRDEDFDYEIEADLLYYDEHANVINLQKRRFH